MGAFTGSPVKLTYDDYLLLPDDNNIHEIIDGDHFMWSSPSTRHQTISRYQAGPIDVIVDLRRVW